MHLRNQAFNISALYVGQRKAFNRNLHGAHLRLLVVVVAELHRLRVGSTASELIRKLYVQCKVLVIELRNHVENHDRGWGRESKYGRSGHLFW